MTCLYYNDSCIPMELTIVCIYFVYRVSKINSMYQVLISLILIMGAWVIEVHPIPLVLGLLVIVESILYTTQTDQPCKICGKPMSSELLFCKDDKCIEKRSLEDYAYYKSLGKEDIK